MNFEQFSLDLPTLHQLTQGPLRQVRALIVTPTRELAEQIYEVSVDLGRNTQVSSVSIYGGVSKGPQVTALQRGAEIVVAYLGSLQNNVLSGEFYAN